MDRDLIKAIRVNETDDAWELDLTSLYYGPFSAGLEIRIYKSSHPLRDYFEEAASLEEALDHALVSAYDNAAQTFRDHGLEPPMDLCLTVGPHPAGRPYHDDPTLTDWQKESA